MSRDEAVPLVVYEGPRIDLVHPTREGYRALAETLRAHLTEAGWVPPS